MGHKSKRRGGKAQMSKGPPKISRNEEENQSVALFESSIPTTATRSKSIQRVYDDEDSSKFQEASSSSGEESSESEVDAAKQLMVELGAVHNEPISSSDYSSEDESEDGLSGSEDDPQLSENDLVAEESESEGSVSESDGQIKHEKRNRASDIESHSSGVSGSSDELSLADSSDLGGEEATPDMKPPKKKSKPLDDAVDPDDIQSARTDSLKRKPAITETIKDTDNFATHFEKDVEDKVISEVTNRKLWTSHKLELGALGHATYSHAPSAEELKLPSPTATLPSLGLRSRLFNLIGKTLKQHCKVSQTSDKEPTLNPEQRQLFYVINQYKDLYIPRLTFNNMEEYRLVYCMHALNHVLKTRLRVTLNSEEKWSAEKRKKHTDKEYRDQGLTRPKVLILAPFKESARKIINIFESLLMTKKKSFITNKKRFTEEFSPPEDLTIDPKKPEDYSQMFEGNTDDCFRLGVQLSKSGMKLYADFYKADILVCSPLGLRMILGAEGDEKRDYDFMSSIEVLIMDQTDVYLMQNWDHVLHVLSLLHVQPKESRDTDFSRVRMWTLNGHARHYRQTIVQSSVHDPHIAAIFARHCSNYSGEVRLQPLQSPGSICHITTALPLIFQRFPCSSYTSLPDDRFTYFIDEVLPQYTDKQQTGTLIYVPSYYDYVRIRNHLSKNEHDTSLVCEYASDKAIRRAKKKFYTKETHFMLYTERVHFFRRMQLRKIRHLIFYSLPTYPQFFSDVCNMYKTGGQADASCLVLFSNHEAYKLSACVGTDRTRHMVSAKKNLFMFVTGDE